MDYVRKYSLPGIFLILIIVNITLWYAVYRELPSKILTVAFLDIGQGDSIYIESPNHNRLIVDGGPNSNLLPQLANFVPWYRRFIDMIIVTNPDADHYSGFIDLLDRYGVGEVLEPGTKSATPTYATFEKSIVNHDVPKMLARRGMHIHLDEGANINILFPDKDVSTWPTNDGSIVAQLVYGSTTVMLTGDAPSKTEEYVLSLDGNRLKSTILKVAHHGSRTSASEPFVHVVAPEYAVISAGLHNSYGHPHKETLDLLSKFHIPTLVTLELGTIVMKTDGKTYSIK